MNAAAKLKDSGDLADWLGTQISLMMPILIGTT